MAVIGRRIPFYIAILLLFLVVTTFFLIYPPYHFKQSTINPWLGPSIAIVLLLDRNDTSSVISIEETFENKKKYAQKFGYILAIKKMKEQARAPTWAKIPALLETMEDLPSVDWLWWIDASAIITNSSLPITTNILHQIDSTHYEDRQLLIGYDCFGINTGSFLIRNSAWSKKFLRTVYGPKFLDYPNEESVMEKLIEEEAIEVAEKVFVIKLRILNSLPPTVCEQKDRGVDRYTWHKGDFVINLSGCGNTLNCDNITRDVWRHLGTEGHNDLSSSTKHKGP
ncbi:hypothetical protein G9A89_003929 [Geosiphon pyriformis]|nr:hypothetical protein G9A89_003929 [Geosiphon pyriformis]